MDAPPRGQFFRRKIVDRDGRGDGFGSGFELCRLVGGDGALLHRLIDIAHARRMHAVADRLHRDRHGEGALKQRKAVVAFSLGRMEQIDGETIARRATAW